MRAKNRSTWLGFELVEKAEEFPAEMTVLTCSDDLAVKDVEREQRLSAMPFVIVSLTFRQSGP